MATFGDRQTDFDIPTAPSIGPPASLGELYDAALETQRAQRNAYWIETEREAAYDAHIASVRDASGIDLVNPIRAKREVLGAKRPAGKFIYYGLGLSEFFRDPEDAFQARLQELATQRPDIAHIIRPDARPDQAVLERAAKSERSEQLAGDRRGGAWWLFTDPLALGAQFAGSFRGMIEDPANALTLGLGPMSRVGLGGRAVLWNGLKSGAANAAVEAAQQPFVQSWRQRAGLEAGLSNAAVDVATAFAFGGLLDAGGRSAYRGLARARGWTPELDAEGVTRWRGASQPAPADTGAGPVAAKLSDEDALDAAARSAPASSRIRQAAEGDLDSLHMIAKQAGLDRDPAYRGARQAAEIDDAVLPPAPRGVAPDVHAEAMQQAMRAAVDPSEMMPHLPARADAGAALPGFDELSEAGRAAVTEAGRRQEQMIELLRTADGERAEAALRAGTADPVEAAGALRDYPGLDRPDLPQTPGIEMARDLARLSDAAFQRIEAGHAPPEHGQMVARMAPNPADHAMLLDALARAAPADPEMARAVIADQLERPSAAVHAALLRPRAVPEDVPVVSSPVRFVDPDTGASLTPGEVDAIVDMWRYVQEKKNAKAPERLSSWVIRNGRLRDEGGEISSILGRGNRLLISGKGMTLDDAALSAWEAGYFHGNERPSISDFLSALDDDVRGNFRYSDVDRDLVEDLAVAREMETELDKLGLGKVKAESEIIRHFSEGQGAEGAARGASPVGVAAKETGRLDNPAGPEAKAQTETLRRDLAPNIERAQRIEDLKASLRTPDGAAPDASAVIPRLAGTDYTPAFVRQQEQIADEIVAAAVKTLPPSVRIAVEDRIRIGAYELNGYFDRRDNLVAVALDSQAWSTFSHERIHALRHHGLFTDAEWGLLTEAANKQRVRAEIGREDLAQYVHLYGRRIALDRIASRIDPELARMGWDRLELHLVKAGLYDPKDPRGSLTRAGLWDEARLQDLIDEEAVARLAERWGNGERVAARLDKLFQRVAEFLERVANVLRGHGFQTADDVFRRVESGEVGLRTPREHVLPGGGKVQGILLTDLMAAIKAFHGSPHDFAAERLVRYPDGRTEYIVGVPDRLPDIPQGAELVRDFPLGRFRMDKIGTGEGAQVYGRGLYTAEAEGVAKNYRDNLSADRAWKDKAIREAEPKLAQTLVQRGYPEDLAASVAQTVRLEHVMNTPEASLARLYGNRGPEFNRALADAWAVKNDILGGPTGRMYEVRINADPEQFLDWDKPLSQQNSSVHEGVDKLLSLFPADRPLDKAKLKPSDVIEMAGRGRAEEALREYGIPGVKYLDQGSRSAGQGSRNYVVFDDSIIEIVAKDGVPVNPFKSDMDAATRAGELSQMAEACKL